MYVPKPGCDTEVGGDGQQGLMYAIDVFWLRVQAVVVNRLIVDTILFATGDTDLLYSL